MQTSTMPALKQQFQLKPDVHYLNFGAFGACPKPVFENLLYWQRLLEEEPTQFIAVHGPERMAHSRQALSDYLNAGDKDNVVYVTNPSFGVNAIAKNLNLQPGDEILTTDIEYGACDRIWDFYCTQAKAVYRRHKMRLPVTSKEDFVTNFFEGLNKNTKAIFISHITSSTALIFPVKEICEVAKSKGLITIVDGAHAPAQVPVDLQDLKADFYTGACHKWMMAPKGCSFLYATKEAQQMMNEPVVVSWGYKPVKSIGSNFLDYNQMIGTRDFSAFLTVPACIKFMEENNWVEVSRKCHEMVLANAGRFYELLGTQPISPLTSEWIGQMISIPIKTNDPDALQKKLFDDYKVEVPITRQDGKFYLRYSINGFNTQEDLDALFGAVKRLSESGL